MLTLAALAVLGASPTEAAAQAANQWRGPQHIYDSTCVYCHETGVAPRLKGRGLPEAFVRLRLRRGYGAMPAFRPSEISPADAAALARWLASGGGMAEGTP